MEPDKSQQLINTTFPTFNPNLQTLLNNHLLIYLVTKALTSKTTMQFTLTTACLLTTALASPLFGTTSNLKYPAAPLTDVACKLSQAITPGTPLVFLFPAANKLGTVVGPVLRGAIGAENVEKLDALADYLCM